MARPSKRQVKKWLDLWKPILALEDWVIDVIDDEPRKADGRRGHCRPYLASRWAVIKLYYTADTKLGLAGWEEVLLHELIHVTQAELRGMIDESSCEGIIKARIFVDYIERDARRFARALIEARKEGKKKH